MALTAGQLLSEDFDVYEMTTKTNTAITRGQICAYDTDGLAPSDNTVEGPHYIALDNVTAVAGATGTARFCFVGPVSVTKVGTQAIAAGQGVMPSATAGSATLWAVVDADDAANFLGFALEDAAEVATVVKILKVK